MTLGEADKIVQIWGRYLEYVHGRLSLVFFCYIPESFLPFPKDMLLESLNIMAEHHHKTGNLRGVELMQSTSALPNWYVDDEEALLQAAKTLDGPKGRRAILPALKAFQKDWMETQRDF